MWVEVTPSEFPHERQGLDYVKKRLPEPEPYRAWSNFTFTDRHGTLSEVDLFVVTPARVVLVELKGYPGLIEGDAGQWRWTSPTHTRPKVMDNPLHLADRKAKRLLGVLQNTRAGRAHKGRFPYLESAVFLHAENLTCKLSADGRHHVFGLDENPTIDGLMAHLKDLDPRYGRQVDRPTSAMMPAHLKWIETQRLYNMRTGNRPGAVTLTSDAASADVLLLWTAGTDEVHLWQLSDQVVLLDADVMRERGYPREPRGVYLCRRVVEPLEVPSGWAVHAALDVLTGPFGAPQVVSADALWEQRT